METKTTTMRMTQRKSKKGANSRLARKTLERTYNVVSGVQPSMNPGPPAKLWKWDKLVDYGMGFQTSASADTFSSLNFVLTDVPEYASFSALFDQYRIARIEVWMQPTGSGYTRWASVVDLDDATNLASFAAALSYASCLESNLNCGHYRNFVPAVAISAYAGAFGAYANELAPWIDLASTGVNHYGLKFAAKTSAVATPMNITAKFHLEFRSTR